MFFLFCIAKKVSFAPYWCKSMPQGNLTGIQIGLLTIYDMCKAVDRGMVIKEVKLLEKSGGKSGTWVAEK